MPLAFGSDLLEQLGLGAGQIVEEIGFGLQRIRILPKTFAQLFGRGVVEEADVFIEIWDDQLVA